MADPRFVSFDMGGLPEDVQDDLLEAINQLTELAHIEEDDFLTAIRIIEVLFDAQVEGLQA